MLTAVRTAAKRILPHSLWNSLRLLKDIVRSKASGVPRAPLGTDLVGYEKLVRMIRAHNVLRAEGDFVEIGTFLGGGAFKLAKFLEKAAPGRKVHVLDVFDPTFDWTQNVDGKAMADVYKTFLGDYHGKTQWEVFQEVTKDCSNINVIKGDSKRAEIPGRLSFGFIDGNHDPEYVESDFYLIWNKLSPGDAVAFHDYEWDLPQTTARIKELTAKHAGQIHTTEFDPEGHILFVVKK